MPTTPDTVPAGNGVAARTLIQLGYFAGESRYLETAERCLKAGWQSISEHPISHCSMLGALRDYLTPPETIILRGNHEELTTWTQANRQQYHPSTLIFAIENQQHVSGALADKAPIGGGCAYIYICTGNTCASLLFATSTATSGTCNTVSTEFEHDSGFISVAGVNSACLLPTPPLWGYGITL